MFIKSMTFQGVQGDVEIAHTDDGALITCGNTILCEVLRAEPREARFDKAYEVARVICGECRERRTGRRVPNATNSMLHDLCHEIDRVAGC